MSALNHPADATERLAQAVAHMQHAFSLIYSAAPGIFDLLPHAAINPWSLHSPGLDRPASSSGNDQATPSIIDEATFSVRWSGCTCRLGNTVAFRLLARLARRPNQFLSYERLRAGIWDDCESDAAVQSAVKVLRRKLNAAGMPTLAAVLDGSVSRHYALLLDKLRG
jgi:DNA-binding response OmpR family regulator